MKGSTSAWAASIALASLCGPLLTLADAAPAPQTTALRPRYYFPKHVKRQIVTNETAPAPQTVVESSVSESPSLTSRQSTDFIALLESLAGASPLSSSSVLPVPYSTPSVDPDANRPLPIPTVDPSVVDPVVASSPSVAPAPASPPPSLLDVQPSVAVAPLVGSVAGIPESIVQPSSAVVDVVPTLAVVASSVDIPASNPVDVSAPASPAPSVASTGGIPDLLILPSPSSVVELAPSPSASSNILESLLPVAPLVSSLLASSGGLPDAIIQPSSVVPEPSAAPFAFVGSVESVLSSAALPSDVGSTGGILVPLVAPTTAAPSEPVPTEAPSNPINGILVGLSTVLNGNPASAAVSEPASAAPTLNPLESPLGILPSIGSALSVGVSSLLVDGDAPSSSVAIIPIPAITSDIPSIVTPAADPSLIPGVLPSVSGILTGIAPIISSDLPAIQSSIADVQSSVISGISASLESQLASVAATATDAAVVPSLASEYSSILSSAAASLSSEATLLPIPVPTPESSAAVVPVPLPITSDVPAISAVPIPSSVVPPIPESSPLASISVPTPASDLPLSVGPSSAISVLPSGISDGGASLTGNNSGIAVPSGPVSPSSELPISSAEPTSSTALGLVPTPSSSAQVQTEPKGTLPPASIVPTGTDTYTVLPTISGVITASSSVTTIIATQTGIPSSMPKIIQAPDGTPPPPKNHTLCQVGFNFSLNYPFVSSVGKAASQIFDLLPGGVGYGLALPPSEIPMYTLQPFDTQKDLGYITTLALFYVPDDLVNKLYVDLKKPVSPLYQNPDSRTNDLMGMIDPSFPLIAGQTMDGSSKGPGSSSANGKNFGDGAPFSGDAAASKPANGTAAGIAVAASAGAVLYGVGMVFIARRYRKNRTDHSRSSSVHSFSDTRSGYMSGGPWMTGARGRDSRGSGGSGGTRSSQGRSIRTMPISAPVMAENSLGWN